ncbi:hypothetical protein QUF95_13155 [Paenibacillus silvae]|nr:hypothetical protein [Paenibacillus barcinonensis]MDM5278343.1 hypothetical protein [Paenibacillus silvae]
MNERIYSKHPEGITSANEDWLMPFPYERDMNQARSTPPLQQ